MVTDRVERPALRGTLLGTLLRLLNPIMRLLLGSPVHWPLSRWWLLLRWRGPKTGEPHTVTLSYVRDGSALYVTTGDRWWRNAVESSEKEVRLSGTWRRAQLEAVTDAAESVSTHARVFRAHPWFRVLAGIPRSGRGGPDRDAVTRAVEAGRTLIRVSTP